MEAENDAVDNRRLLIVVVGLFQLHTVWARENETVEVSCGSDMSVDIAQEPLAMELLSSPGHEMNYQLNTIRKARKTENKGEAGLRKKLEGGRKKHKESIEERAFHQKRNHHLE